MDPKIDLKTILGLHAKWLRAENGGKQADLQRADLQEADLQRANLRGASLQGANLQEANLQGANLLGASLQGCKEADLALAMCSHLPEGQFDAWKICKDGVLVNLRIPANARRSHGSERKCRAEFVKVIGVYKDGKPHPVGISLYDSKTEYRKGCMVYPDGWDEDRWNTCGQGIHFFLTRLEAENYQYQ